MWSKVAWNGVDPRACLPTPEMLVAEDVLAFSDDMRLKSPSKLGIGMYIVPKNSTNQVKAEEGADSNNNTQPMPLMYVSPKVAADRSLKCPQVQPGWYVIAKPGQCFEIHLSSFHPDAKSLIALQYDDIIASMFVDGVESTRCGVILGNSEYVWRGVTKATHANNTETIMKYEFQTVTGEESAGIRTEEGTGNRATAADVGTLRLELTAAMKGQRLLDYIPKAHVYGTGSTAKVTEKEMIKKGASIGVGGSTQAVDTRNPAIYSYPTQLRTKMPEKSITIYIRERMWLESRRIIDGDGLPATAEVAKKGIGATRTKQGATGFNSAASAKKTQGHTASSSGSSSRSTSNNTYSGISSIHAGSHSGPNSSAGSSSSISIDVDGDAPAQVKREGVVDCKKKRKIVVNVDTLDKNGHNKPRGEVIVLD